MECQHCVCCNFALPCLTLRSMSCNMLDVQEAAECAVQAAAAVFHASAAAGEGHAAAKRAAQLLLQTKLAEVQAAGLVYSSKAAGLLKAPPAHLPCTACRHVDCANADRAIACAGERS